VGGERQDKDKEEEEKLVRSVLAETLWGCQSVFGHNLRQGAECTDQVLDHMHNRHKVLSPKPSTATSKSKNKICHLKI
jgi:hypothetical protein